MPPLDCEVCVNDHTGVTAGLTTQRFLMAIILASRTCNLDDEGHEKMDVKTWHRHVSPPALSRVSLNY